MGPAAALQEMDRRSRAGGRQDALPLVKRGKLWYTDTGIKTEIQPSGPKMEAEEMEETNRGGLDPERYLESNPFMQHNHMKITKISEECSEICMEVYPEGLNLMGMVHGGLIYSLADVVTGITARADGRKYVTQSAHINFIGNVSGGTVTAKGILVRRGRSITIVRGVVTDETGRLLADVTVDMFCLG